jgi:hypothetical protein
VQAAHPGHQFVAVGVARQAGQVADLGAHRHVLAVDLDLGGTGHQPRAAAAADLEAGKHTWCRASGAIAFRWCSTRPPVAMPLAEMITDGQRDRDSRIDCATVSTSVTPSTRPFISRGGTRSSRACRRYSAVAATAIGLSTKTGTCAGMAPRRFSRCSSSSSACARPTANDGSSTEPPRSMVRLTMSASARPGLPPGAPVAVGRLDDQHVGPRHGLGRWHQQVVLAAEVATEHQPVATAIGQGDAAGAQQVPGRCQRDAQPADLLFAPGRQRLETGDGPLRVGLGVQRQRLLVARIAVAVGAPRVLFLQVRAVHQQHRARSQVAGDA